MQPVRARRTWDLVLTIVFLVLHLGVAALASFVGFFLAFASDSCGASSVCNYDQIATGMMIGIGGPIVIAVLTLIVSIVLIVVRRIAFWVPLVGSVLAIVVEAAAFFVATSGVSSFTY